MFRTSSQCICPLLPCIFNSLLMFFHSSSQEKCSGLQSDSRGRWIITKAMLRLYGIPEAVVSTVCSFSSGQAAVDSTVQILQCDILIAEVESIPVASIELSNMCNRQVQLVNQSVTINLSPCNTGPSGYKNDISKKNHTEHM
ncbi:UNVERIFIED_CONTAM: hypothetical protein FKN15_066304 [Acipenser sinensis]